MKTGLFYLGGHMDTLYVVLVVFSSALAAGLLLAPVLIFIRKVEAALWYDLGDTPADVRRFLGRRCYFGMIFDSLRYSYTPAAVADQMAIRIRLRAMELGNA